MSETFAGDKKTGQSLLGTLERRFIDWGIPKVPRPILSHHLTMLTLVWSAGTVLFGWLADGNRAWLHGVSVMVFFQWLTDSFDGSLGKYRKQGLVKWGFYMDHLLDLLFAGSIVIAYSFLVEARWLEFLFLILLLVTCATMAVSFVCFAGTDIFSWGVPVIVALNLAAFATMAAQTSRNLWRIDYETNIDGAPRP